MSLMLLSTFIYIWTRTPTLSTWHQHVIESVKNEKDIVNVAILEEHHEGEINIPFSPLFCSWWEGGGFIHLTA